MGSEGRQIPTSYYLGQVRAQNFYCGEYKYENDTGSLPILLNTKYRSYTKDFHASQACPKCYHFNDDLTKCRILDLKLLSLKSLILLL